MLTCRGSVALSSDRHGQGALLMLGISDFYLVDAGAAGQSVTQVWKWKMRHHDLSPHFLEKYTVDEQFGLSCAEAWYKSRTVHFLKEVWMPVDNSTTVLECCGLLNCDAMHLLRFSFTKMLWAEIFGSIGNWIVNREWHLNCQFISFVISCTNILKWRI